MLKGGGYLVRSPSIDLAEMGAGGGSLAWIDKGGVLRVGPQSAGADPGPACYAHGGTQPTVTDANVVLGFLNPRHLLDGAMPIDSSAAEAAITDHVGHRLGLPVHQAAYGIHSVANAAMTRAIQIVSSEIGRSPGDFTLVAFGGSGPVHAATLAAHAGISEIIVPPAPGVFSALGLLLSRIQHRLVAPYWQDIAHIDYEKLNRLSETLAVEAKEMMAGEGVQTDSVELQLSLDLRYAGQSSELALDIPNPPISSQTVAGAAERFHQEHERTYGYCSREERIQLVNIRLRVRSREGNGRLSFSSSVSAGSADATPFSKPSDRPAFFGLDHGWISTPVIRRNALNGRECPGPLIVEEYDTTIVVPPGAVVRSHSGTVRIKLDGGQ
jgi:N-methylhydantoinase A